LKNNSDISIYIRLLEQLDDTYGKTKTSLDENTTFLIGLLKIVSGYSQTVSQNQNTLTKPIVNNLVKGVDNQPLKSPISNIDLPVSDPEIKKDVISTDDAFDVFGSEPIKLEKKSEPISS
jgi:hypothetical protein